MLCFLLRAEGLGFGFLRLSLAVDAEDGTYQEALNPKLYTPNPKP